MLIKNVLKGIKNKPLRIISIIFMVFLAGFLYVSVQYTLTTVDNSLHEYVDEYNQEDFSFDMNPYLSNDEKETYGNVQYLYQLSKDNQYTIIENRINALENQYQINIEQRTYKQINYQSTQLNKTITLRLFKNTHDLNKTYVEQGRLPQTKNEIGIGRKFAEKNGLGLQDSLVINEIEYTIVGYVYFVDYIYPQLSNQSIVFNASKQVLGVLNDEAFEHFDASKVTYFSGQFMKETYTKEDINQIENSFYTQNLVDAKTAMRTGAIYGEIKADKAMINALSAVILILAVVIIGITVNKTITSERRQIGVIKSLGYNNKNIISAFMLYPLIASIIGSFLGYFSGYYLSEPFTSFFNLYFQMPINEIKFNWTIFFNSIILPMIALNVLSVIIIYYIAKKEPLDLMRIKVSEKTSIFVQKLRPLYKRLSFVTQFKYSIALRSVGKLIITFIGILIASIYLIFALSFSSSFNRIVDSTSPNADYKYQIIFNQPRKHLKDETDDRFMQIPANMVQNNEDISVTLMGIDENLNYYALENSDNENLVPKIYQDKNNVVISSMLAMIHDIDIDDVIHIKTNNMIEDENGQIQQKESLYEVKVVGIMENYTMPYIFMQLRTLNGYYYDSDVEEWYNGVWTNERKTENVESIFDQAQLTKSIEQMTGVFKGFIYLLVGVSVILAIIVLVIISIYTIEDNFKTISFLKVMGYRDKEVNQMVLNIYLPIILMAYLFSIPLTLMSLRSIMKMISSELNFAIPFDLTIIQILIGILIIGVTYYLSLLIARRKLIKVSLQEALKINE